MFIYQVYSFFKFNMSEVVEQDTIDSEEIPNLLEFMLPSDGLNSNYSVFGFS